MHARAGIFMVIALLAFIVLGSYYDPFRVQPGDSFASPSSSFWFGADRLGRDMLARTARALRNTLLDAGVAELVSFGFCLAVSALVAAGSSYRMRALEHLLDATLAALRGIPAFLPAFAIAVLFRENMFATPLALILFSVIYSLPVYLAECRRAFDTPFAEGAVALGAPWMYNLTRCILPEALPRIARFALLDFASLVAFAALLGVVGLSQPPEPNLGELIFEARVYIRDYYWLFLAPTAVLVITLMTAWSFGSE